MPSIEISEHALGLLREAKAAMLEDTSLRKIIDAKDRVVSRYSPSFQHGVVNQLEEEVLRSFLYIENNHHWSGLNRQVNRVCADMPKTRAALTLLVDETQPISARMQPVADIKGMGRGIITAILHVAFPDTYGVWNNTSHEGLEELELLPDFPRGSGFGERYAVVNEVLVELASILSVDLWTLDTVWWYLAGDDATEGFEFVETESPVSKLIEQSPKAMRFALERHLHDYMYDNWDALEISDHWSIFEREGEPDAGYELRTPVGRLDLLAKHRSEARWLVIELKREKSADAVVGQVLRYMGWVQAHLAESGETVEGLIVATEGSPQLHYAIHAAPAVSFKSYEVEFRLKDGPTFDEFATP